MIRVQEAKTIIKSHIFPSEMENVPLGKAENRVLAQDVTATFSMPRFDNSAMDGFAVRAVDTQGASQSHPVTLKIVGISSAGKPSDVTLGSGECIQCMTGAKIPVGADTVVMVEDTSGFSEPDAVKNIFGSTSRKTYSKKKEKKFGKGMF